MSNDCFAYLQSGATTNLSVYFSDTIPIVKQSAALCLLRLLRTSPNCLAPGEWSSRVIHLLNDQHMVRFHSYDITLLILSAPCLKGKFRASYYFHKLRVRHVFQGVVTAATSLIHALAQLNPDEYRGCVSLAVSRFSRIVTSTYTDLQVRLILSLKVGRF